MPKGIYLHKKQPLASRLAAKVRHGGNEECWLFTGSLDEHGYGQIWNGYRLVKAHRAAYEIANGPIPERMQACHRCDNPRCCNPSHLFLGTQKDNMQDAVAKKRHRTSFPLYGSEHPSYKIYPTTRLAIRSDVRSHRVIAAAFGISKTQVGRIKREADTAGEY